jgi:hypothetical protein
MKLYELLTESKKQPIDEAPMGMLNTLGNKAMAKFGSGRATGKLSTGTLANQLHKEFQTYLGKTGREATKDAVMGFLSSKGYPTQGAATIINQALKGGAAPTGPLANLKTTAKGVAANAAGALKQKGSALAQKAAAGASNMINKATDAMGKVALPSKDDRREFDNPGVEPTLDPETPGSTPDTAALKAKLRAKKGATAAASGFNKFKAAANAKGIVSAGKDVDSSNMVAEAGPGVLPQNIIDKAILKAAQEAETINTKQGKTSAQQTKAPAGAAAEPADDEAPAASGSGGFAAGVKQGFTGKKAGGSDLAGLEQRIAAIEKKVGLA